MADSEPSREVRVLREPTVYVVGRQQISQAMERAKQAPDLK